MKKSQVWISAVLYMGLGVILLTIILAAGMPVVNRLRDKNTVLQTKELMFGLDETIRAILSEGPGSRRAIRLVVGKGDFSIDPAANKIEWTMNTKIMLSEPEKDIEEGTLMIRTDETDVEKEYSTTLTLNYGGIVNIHEDSVKKITGTYDLIIINKGVIPDQDVPTISITEKPV